MPSLYLTVLPAEAGTRLDRYLVERFPRSISRAAIQRLIRTGEVTVNGRVVKSHYATKAKDHVVAHLPQAATTDLPAEPIPLEIVYEDNDLVVVNKPSGMVVHPARGHARGTLVNALLAHCRTLSRQGGAVRPGIVHRLDRGTSGLLVVAKNDETHRALARQFKERTVVKKYLAVVEGQMALEGGTIDLPIGRHPRHRERMAIRFAESRQALTHYRVLKRGTASTLVLLTLRTGRTHQIRVHLAHLGYPVVGDPQYGRKETQGRMALHAQTLGFVHPRTSQYLEWSCEPPPDFPCVF